MTHDFIPWVHWRSSSGTALCAMPARQIDLVDKWDDVTCPHCSRKAGVAAKQQQGAA